MAILLNHSWQMEAILREYVKVNGIEVAEKWKKRNMKDD